MVGLGVALVILGVDLAVLGVDLVLVVLGMDLAGVVMILAVLGRHCCITSPLHYTFFLRKRLPLERELRLEDG